MTLCGGVNGFGGSVILHVQDVCQNKKQSSNKHMPGNECLFGLITFISKYFKLLSVETC
jgi:hypothetical protein